MKYSNSKKQLSLFLVVVMVITFFCVASNAQTISGVPKEIESYERAMKEIQTSLIPVSLEEIFEKGLSAAKILMNRSNTLDWFTLERFDFDTFEKVKLMMTGFWVNRDDVVVVKPNPDFWVKLAMEKGSEIDKIFFHALQKTYIGWFPVYMKQSSDFSGCVIFDGETITEAYGQWFRFQKNYPDKYIFSVRTELEKIEDNMMNICICDDEDNYLQELNNFVKLYPDASISDSVSSRLETTGKYELSIRFYCVGGM